MSYTFNFTVAEDTMTTMNKANSDMASDLQELTAYHSAHAGDFTGAAASNYAQVEQVWQQQAGVINQALQQAQQALNNISSAMSDAETQGSKIWSNTQLA